jgi:hypothetical protein
VQGTGLLIQTLYPGFRGLRSLGTVLLTSTSSALAGAAGWPEPPWRYRLLQDLSTTQAGSFRGKVGINNATTGSRQVFIHRLDVLDRLFKTGLNSPQIGTAFSH